MRRMWLAGALLALLALILWGIAAYVADEGPSAGGGEKPESTFVPLGVPVMVYDHRKRTVEEMDLEMYTFRAMGAEMPASFGMEALKAQAVASRTLAVYRMNGRPCGEHGGDVCTDYAHCQAYLDEEGQRKYWGKDYDARCERLWQAVNATRGEIVTYGGAPIEVFFHSTSGGQTEDAENVFSHAKPYLVSVSSAGEESAPRYRSTVNIPRAEFINRVNALCPAAKLSPGALETGVRVLSRFASGRVETVAAGKATVTGQQVRSLFALDSTNFAFSFTDNDVVIQTIGYGHGVGMSQVGADAMAKRGAGYREILTHYYRGVQIEKLPQ